MRISKFTLCFSIYIIISSLFMQRVLRTAAAIFGMFILRLFFILICLAAVAAILYKNIKSEFNVKRAGLICAVSIWGFIFAWRQPYFPEKAHVLEFALLGWFVMTGLAKKSRGLLKDMLTAVIFVAIIGFVGEGFQKFLPWRVCEIRDMITDCLSGILGIALFLISK